MTLLRNLRFIGFLEGLSFLLLLGIAMPLKYMFDMPSAVRHIGMAHGILFILYVILVLWAGVRYKWSAKNLTLATVASVIPFGTFYADRKIFRQKPI